MWKTWLHLFRVESALALQETTTKITTTETQEGIQILGIDLWIVLTILGFIAFVVIPMLFRRRRRRREPTEQTSEIERAREEQQRSKTKSKEVRALRRDIIKAILFIMGIYFLFHWSMFHWYLGDLGVDTQYLDIFSVGDLVLLLAIGIHGISKILGRVAIRGTEKDPVTGKGKQYNILLGEYEELNPTKLKKIYAVYQRETNGQNTVLYKSILAMEATESENTEITESEPFSLPEPPALQSGEFAVTYEIMGSLQQSVYPKEKLSFLKKLSPYDLKGLIDAGNAIILQQEGVDAYVASPITHYLRTYMPVYGYDIETIETTCKYIKELPREKDEGIAFGGFRLYLCDVKQYDTEKIILVLRDTFENSFDFGAVDEVDSTYLPLPMKYTDLDWIKIGVTRVQLTPEIEEFVHPRVWNLPKRLNLDRHFLDMIRRLPRGLTQGIRCNIFGIDSACLLNYAVSFASCPTNSPSHFNRYNHKIINDRRKRQSVLKNISLGFVLLSGIDPCGICRLAELEQIGVYGVKIVGRNYSTKKKVKDIKFLKAVLTYMKENQVKSLEGFKSFVQDKFRQVYKMDCGNLCYYPNEV